MVTHAGFQPWTVRRRFGAILPVFASLFFCFLCSLRADIIYLDENGIIISSEKTEIDKDGNIIVVPSEQVVEEIVTPADVERRRSKMPTANTLTSIMPASPSFPPGTSAR